MLNSAIRSGLFKHNAYVKAWCLVTNHSSPNTEQYLYSNRNFVDGHNLYIDSATQSYLSTTGSLATAGGLKFSFVNPMQDTNYKVFVQAYFGGSLVSLSHCINSLQYPKTTTSFWIREGVFSVPGTPAPPETGRTHNQIAARRVWGNATHSIGILVI
jgi:hypothetical protein